MAPLQLGCLDVSFLKTVMYEKYLYMDSVYTDCLYVSKEKKVYMEAKIIVGLTFNGCPLRQDGDCSLCNIFLLNYWSHFGTPSV